jgi:hypothetical protein
MWSSCQFQATDPEAPDSIPVATRFSEKYLGLERDPLIPVSITEELLEWKSSGFGLENEINDRGNPLRWPRDTLYPQKLVLTSPTSGGHSVGIVHLRTEATEFILVLVWHFSLFNACIFQAGYLTALEIT